MLHVVSFSGGKDSTCMLLKMIELNYKIDEIVFCDTGVEFPEMYDHINKVEKMIKRKITRQKSPKTFKFLMMEFEKRNGQIGYSWPDMSNRWCTQRLKKDEFKKALTKIKRKHGDKHVIEYHGIALDEEHRTLKNNEKVCRYPLIDWGMEEKDALEYCYNKGLDWGGLYKMFDRVSCYLCPFSNLPELKKLYLNYPELWEEMKKLELNTWRSFKQNATVQDLENKFNNEENWL